MYRPVIFVDIDGPLLSGRQWFSEGNIALYKEFGKEAIAKLQDPDKNKIQFDPIAVKMFNLWLKYANAQVVLSTYWMHHFTKSQLVDILEYNGLVFDLHDKYETPKFINWMHRGNEISRWLYNNKHDSFLVVDDNPAIEDAEELENHRVLVDYQNGISTKDFKKGCQILGIDYEKVYEDEFGVKKLTDEEKEQQRHDFNLLATCVF